MAAMQLDQIVSNGELSCFNCWHENYEAFYMVGIWTDLEKG